MLYKFVRQLICNMYSHIHMGAKFRSSTMERVPVYFQQTHAMATVRPLPDDLQKIAIAELNEVPERVADDIAALKTWIQQQPHLNARTDDQFLLAFLRGCKFSLEKAKSKIDKYYTLKTKYPEFYTIQNVDDPRVLEMVRLGVGINLPTPLNENGPRITLVRPGAYPADKFTFEDVMSVAHALQETSFWEDDYVTVNGFIDVLDMSGMTTAHLLQMTPSVFKKMSIFAEEAVPLRQKGSHFINTPTSFEAIYNMLKPMMPAKQQERLYVHGNNLSSLYEHVPQKYLPKEYGGENSSIADIIAGAEQDFSKYRDYFIEDKEYRCNEKLRPGKSVDYDNVFGVDGSFRKINVD